MTNEYLPALISKRSVFLHDQLSKFTDNLLLSIILSSPPSFHPGVPVTLTHLPFTQEICRRRAAKLSSFVHSLKNGKCEFAVGDWRTDQEKKNDRCYFWSPILGRQSERSYSLWEVGVIWQRAGSGGVVIYGRVDRKPDRKKKVKRESKRKIKGLINV